MPTAMLSILQYYAPQTQMSPRHLLMSCGPKRTGIGIIEAAMIFNALGIAARALSPTQNSVPTPTAAFKRVWGYPRFVSKHHFIERKLKPDFLRRVMKNGHKVIICVDDDPIAHAHILTGFTRDYFLHHDSRSFRPTRGGSIPESRPHAIMHKDELFMRWAEHEFHTLVVSGKSTGAESRILQAEEILNTAATYATNMVLAERGIKAQPPKRPKLIPILAH